jgi:hypothetical protein
MSERVSFAFAHIRLSHADRKVDIKNLHFSTEIFALQVGIVGFGNGNRENRSDTGDQE